MKSSKIKLLKFLHLNKNYPLSLMKLLLLKFSQLETFQSQIISTKEEDFKLLLIDKILKLQKEFSKHLLI